MRALSTSSRRLLPLAYNSSLNPNNFTPGSLQRIVKVCPRTGEKAIKVVEDEENENCQGFVASNRRYFESLARPHNLPTTPFYPSVFRPPSVSPWSGSSMNLNSTSMSLDYSSMSGPHSPGAGRALRLLYEHGICLVKGVPPSPEHQWALSECFTGGSRPSSSCGGGGRVMMNLHSSNSGPQKTLFGSTWSTTATSGMQGQGTSTADSAYTSDSLPLHNDMCYFHSPPALQIFTMEVRVLGVVANYIE